MNLSYLSMRLISVLFYAICIAGSPAFSQNNTNATIKGQIKDSETGQALAGANIVITGRGVSTGTASGISGFFEAENLPAGTFTVTASYIGYKDEEVANITLAAGDERILDILLLPIGIQVNPVTITASKRPEKLLDAPAAISVLRQEAIESRMALTPVEHLKAVPAVDIITAGLNQSRVVIRGFNDLLSGSLLSMVDYRMTRIPAIRLNAFQLIPTNNEDVDRIEVVSGPASALYGPNSANGVMHVLTKSPFDSKGTTLSIGGGEQDVILGAFRHAGSLGDNFGYKFSLQHYTGNDFAHIDTTEVKILEIEKRRTTMPDTLRIGQRIFDIKSTNFDGRIDYRISQDLSFILNGGFTKGDNIEMTDQGAAQALNASFQ
jgi:iron complex outermembrane receptor protein